MNAVDDIDINRILVAIADDHPIFRNGLAQLITRLDAAISLVWEAGDGTEVIEQIGKTQPDIILMDIQMPQLDGIQTTTIIKKDYPATKVIALSTFDNLWAVEDMLKAGAEGYLLKTTDKEELLKALQTISNKGTYFTPAVSTHLNAIFESREKDEKHQTLTRREIEIVSLVCEGKSNKEIASHLDISKRTVEGHRKNIMDKVGARNTSDIVMYAVRHGLCKI